MYIEIALELMHSDDEQTLLNRYLDRIAEQVAYDSAAVLRADETGSFVIHAMRHYERWVNPRLVSSFTLIPDARDTLFQQVIQHHKPVLVDDLSLVRSQDGPFLWRHARSWLLIPLVLHEQLFGITTLEHTEIGAFTAEDRNYVAELARYTAAALSHIDRFAGLQSVGSVLTTLHESERDSMADVLHDDIADVLSLIRKSLIRSQTLPSDQFAEHIQQDVELLGEVADKARKLSHNLGALRTIRRFDLVSALDVLFDNFARQTGIMVNCPHAEVDETRLDSDIKLAVYRIVQEALANASKYADVEEVFVRVAMTGDDLTVDVQDEGRGFDIHHKGQGIGLLGMQQRAALLGGSLTIHSEIGRGTRLRITVPLKTQADTTSYSELTQRSISNLMAFARLYGYVRYFCPRDEVIVCDWENLAVEGVQMVEGVTDDEGLIRALNAIFQPLAPQLQLYPIEQPPDTLSLEPAQYVTAWLHHGFGVGNSHLNTPFQDDTSWLHTVAKLQSGYGVVDNFYKYMSERVLYETSDADMPPQFPLPESPFISNLTETIQCRLPLSQYIQNGSQSSPAELLTLSSNPVSYQTSDQRALRMASVIILWNVIQHFYPYFDHMKRDWWALLVESLMGAASEHDTRSFQQVLQHMIAALNDGAARVRLHNAVSYYAPPFIMDWIEGALVVTQILSEEVGGLQRGDIITHIDGASAHEVLIEHEQYASGASAAYRRRSAVKSVWRGQHHSEMALTVQTATGETQQITIQRTIQTSLIPQFSEPRPQDTVTQLAPGVLYVDMTRITRQQFKAALDDLQSASSIIFDVRGFPKAGTSAIEHTIEHLITAPVESMQWYVSHVLYPDRHHTEFELLPGEKITPRAPHFTAKTVFLTDDRAIGRVENYLNIINHYRLSTIIGQSSAGTAGNNDLFTLYNTYDVSWTVMLARKHDGTPHHGVGVQPTYPVERTIAGVRAGRDEVLDAALEFLGV